MRWSQRLADRVTPSDRGPFQSIADLERLADVNALQYRSVHVWPYLRLVLTWVLSNRELPLSQPPGHEITDQSADASPAETHKELLETLHDAERLVLAPVAKLERRDILFWGKAPMRPLTADGTRLDTVVDPIIAQALDGEVSWLKVYCSIPSADAIERYEAIGVDGNRFVALQEQLDRLRGIEAPKEVVGWSKVIASPRGAVARAIAALKSAAPGAVTLLGEDPKWLVAELETIEHLARLAGLVLEQVQPRLVFVVGQNHSSFAMALAAHRRGIPSVDIHHGSAATNSANLKWFGWRQIPEGGYEYLPTVSWAWNKRSAARINASRGGDTRWHGAVVGGNPWLSAAADLTGHKGTPDQSHVSILVTLTYLSVDRPPEFLWEAVRRAPADWRWMLRLHPRDLADDANLAYLASVVPTGNVEYEVASRAPLPVLLGEASRHVTMYSSSYLDASAFGLGTAFISEKARTLFADLVGSPGYVFANDANGLIEHLAKGVPPPEPLAVSSRELTRETFRQLLKGKVVPARRAQTAEH